MRLPVFLVRANLYDRFGMEYQFRERRLVRQNPEDRIIAYIEAPAGSRVRTRPDCHGMDQLLVPSGKSFWARHFGFRKAIPAKYVINCAKNGEHGLRLGLMQAAGSGEIAAMPESTGPADQIDSVGLPAALAS